MTSVKMMEAVGAIGDRYILEFAQPEPVKHAAGVHWLMPAVAGLCLLAGAFGLHFMGGERPPVSLEKPIVSTSQSTIPTEATISETIVPAPTGATIWGDAMHAGHAGVVGGEEDTLKMGTVEVCYCLENTMEKSKNPADVFAVSLIEGSGAEKDVVYKTIVQPLGVEEDFLKKDLIFLTRQQIEDLKCPEDMAIRLCVYGEGNEMLSEGGIGLVGKEYFANLNGEKMDLWICFRAGEEDCGIEFFGECSCVFDKFVYAFLEEYGLTGARWEYWRHGYSHTGILKDVSPDMVYQLLNDPRILFIWHIGECHYGAA